MRGVSLDEGNNKLITVEPGGDGDDNDDARYTYVFTDQGILDSPACHTNTTSKDVYPYADLKPSYIPESLEGCDPSQKMAEENEHLILTTSDNDEKKIIRREIEKQRRTYMSILCASLRSSLPLELIRGKRSASDHIGEAANYIQFLKQKINALQNKRDKLKQVVYSSLVETGTEPENSGSLVKCANINLIQGGVEIAICSGLGEHSSPLSEFMEILLQEGCDIVSCVSTHVNGKIFHTIKSQVEDLTSLDLAKLQHKLDNAAKRTMYNF
ncbi:hypothetical protein RJT34_25095 [Clitoria ternatea]|uniref:BHLH domain-containing protein n=1 Tax=Clitoria ternatea TaxID=43366 RepID=A0AAN9FVZ0_CLITE